MKLPHRFKVGDLSLVATRLNTSSIPLLREWVQTYYGREREVIEDDVLPYQALEEWHLPGRTSLTVFKECPESRQRTLVAASLIFPSLLSRSTIPVNSSAHILVRPDYGRRGIGTAMFDVTHQAAWDSGYLDHVTRVVARNSNTISILAKNNKGVVGKLPHSVFLRGQGRMADLVTHHTEKYRHPQEYESRLQTINSKRNRSMGSNFKQDVHIPDWVLSDTVLQRQSLRIRGFEATCTLRAATQEDIWDVDNMIRVAAAKGHGFALDEFKGGFFNRKFMRECHTVVISSQQGEVIGAALFGLSSLCHSVTSPVLQMYVIVSENARCRGVGRHLLNSVIDYALKNDFISIYADAFDTDSYAIQYLIRNGFQKTASLPKCGFVHKDGLTDGSLYFRDIRSLYRETMRVNIHET